MTSNIKRRNSLSYSFFPSLKSKDKVKRKSLSSPASVTLNDAKKIPKSSITSTTKPTTTTTKSIIHTTHASPENTPTAREMKSNPNSRENSINIKSLDLVRKPRSSIPSIIDGKKKHRKSLETLSSFSRCSTRFDVFYIHGNVRVDSEEAAQFLKCYLENFECEKSLTFLEFMTAQRSEEHVNFYRKVVGYKRYARQLTLCDYFGSSNKNVKCKKINDVGFTEPMIRKLFEYSSLVYAMFIKAGSENEINIAYDTRCDIDVKFEKVQNFLNKCDQNDYSSIENNMDDDSDSDVDVLEDNLINNYDIYGELISSAALLLTIFDDAQRDVFTLLLNLFNLDFGEFQLDKKGYGSTNEKEKRNQRKKLGTTLSLERLFTRNNKKKLYFSSATDNYYDDSQTQNFITRIQNPARDKVLAKSETS
eukprot:Pgem_evm1s11581